MTHAELIREHVRATIPGADALLEDLERFLPDGPAGRYILNVAFQDDLPNYIAAFIVPLYAKCAVHLDPVLDLNGKEIYHSVQADLTPFNPADPAPRTILATQKGGSAYYYLDAQQFAVTLPPPRAIRPTDDITPTGNTRFGVASPSAFADAVRLLRQPAQRPAAAAQPAASQADNTSAQLIDVILKASIERGASDVHFQPVCGNPGVAPWVNVLFRIDGELRPHQPRELYEGHYHPAIVRYLQQLARLAQEPNPLQDGAFYAHGMDWRLSLTPQGRNAAPSVVLRKLDKAAVLLPLNRLILHPTALSILDTIKTVFHHGLVLVTGVTGSGKTTTLYSLMKDAFDHKQGTIKIATIEDPIEYEMDFLVQHQVTQDHTPSRILRALLRADPDWLLVGEIRDREMARHAYESALSGHLTLSTVHSGSVIDTLTRLNDLGITHAELADTVRVIIAQTLLRRLCPSCKITRADGTAVKGHGCPECDLTGERGRVALAECFLNDPDKPTLQAALRAHDRRHLADYVSQFGVTKTRYATWLQQRGLLDATTQPQFHS